MDEALKELGDYIADEMGAAVESSTVSYGELTLVCLREEIPETLRFLRDDARCNFTCLIDICRC